MNTYETCLAILTAQREAMERELTTIETCIRLLEYEALRSGEIAVVEVRG